jgi:hypothetical protein
MSSYFTTGNIQTTRVQDALGTQFLIFVAHDTNPTKRGIFLVDLGHLPQVNPTDPTALNTAISQNMQKLVFTGDNDPITDQVYMNNHGHYMLDVAGNNNILSIGLVQKKPGGTPATFIFTLTALKNRSPPNSGNNPIVFDKCPNASREIPNLSDITELKVLLIGNDPKLHHTAKLPNGQYSNEMAGH